MGWREMDFGQRFPRRRLLCHRQWCYRLHLPWTRRLLRRHRLLYRLAVGRLRTRCKAPGPGTSGEYYYT